MITPPTGTTITSDTGRIQAKGPTPATQGAGFEHKSFQALYQQQKHNLGQIKPTKDFQQSAYRQLENLKQRDPTFPPLENLMLLKEHKPQMAIILTAKVAQHHPARIWDKLSSSERLQITMEHLESICHYLKLDAAELHRTYEIKNDYLSESHLNSYRSALAADGETTHSYIFDKDTIYPHLLVSAHTDSFNCIAESLNDQTQWIWDAIGDSSKNSFEFFEIDQFYQAQGYDLRSGTIDMSLANSIIVFGHKRSGLYHLKHAGRIDENGFYRSKLGTGGTVLWPAPVADACPEYGETLLQYVKSGESP